MRKLLAISAALILGASLLSAQDLNPSGKWYVSVQGGPMYQSSENTFAYRWEGYGSKLFTYSVGAAAGYSFNETWGVRASLSYGFNRSAGNYKQSHNKFYPYDFKNISGFCDLVLDFNGLNAIERCFSPKLYAGMGMGHTFGFTKPTTYGVQKEGRSTSPRRTTRSVSASAPSPSLTSRAASASSPTSAGKPIPTCSTASSPSRSTTPPAPVTRASRSTSAPRWASVSCIVSANPKNTITR